MKETKMMIKEFFKQDVTGDILMNVFLIGVLLGAFLIAMSFYQPILGLIGVSLIISSFVVTIALGIPVIKNDCEKYKIKRAERNKKIYEKYLEVKHLTFENLVETDEIDEINLQFLREIIKKVKEEQDEEKNKGTN
jgi:hypothetical protein